VTVKGLENGKTYNVTATGRGGYRKTLTATLEVNDAKPEIYQYLDTTNSEYALLTVWSKGYKGDVKVTYPNTVAPDNTDGLEAMREAKNGEEYIIDKETFNSATEDITGSYTSHVYRFFRTSENANIDGICAYKVLDGEIIDTKKPE
jgi:hypothetical protein